MNCVATQTNIKVGVLSSVGNYLTVHGKPDTIYIHRIDQGLIKLLLEYKPPWFLKEVDIIQAYNKEVDVYEKNNR